MSHAKNSFLNTPQNSAGQEICNPYIAIEAFFSYYDLPGARGHLDKWFRSAFAKKSRLGKKASLALLDLQAQLICVLEAARLLNDDPDNHEKALLLTTDDATLMNPALYFTPCRITWYTRRQRFSFYIIGA